MKDVDVLLAKLNTAAGQYLSHKERTVRLHNPDGSTVGQCALTAEEYAKVNPAKPKPEGKPA